MSGRACRACGRELRFAKSPATGRALPLERVRAIYQVAVAADGEDEARRVEVEGFVYVSHFETCPEAGRFSRRAGPS